MFEHPMRATSRSESCVAEIAALPGVGAVGMDMCAFGLKSTDRDGEGYAQKRTRIMSNMPAILEGLPRQCQNDHRHVILLDGRAGPAAAYSENFCDQVISQVRHLAEA